MNHIQLCEHPQYYVNKYTGESGYAPCGKCIACKSQHNMHWVERLERERRCWPHTIFFTLTYCNEYQSRLTLTPSGDLVALGRKERVLSTNGDLRVNYVYTGECITADQLEQLNMSQNDIDYLLRRRTFDYIEISDIQKFIKRLRYYVSEIANKKKESTTLRYFIASEVGPTTLRQHLHGLLFISSQEVYKCFDEIINKSWKLSEYNIDWSPVISSASAYAASYCNSITGLPAFYKLRPLRPFVLCSRHPAIGTLDPPHEEVNLQKIIDNLDVTFMLPRSKSTTYVHVPIWREIYGRLFPKITGFNRVSDTDRITLYGIAFNFPHFQWKEFRRWFYSKVDDASTFVSPYLDKLCPFLRLASKFDLHATEGYQSMLRSIVYSLGLDENGLKRVWYTSKRVFTLCQSYHINLTTYVQKIADFYSKLNYERLRGYFFFQQDFARNSPSRLFSWINCDSMFMRTLAMYRNARRHFPKWIRSTLRSFNINPLKAFKDNDYFNSLSCCTESEDYFRNLHLAYQDSHKNKMKNEYIDKHPELSYLVYNNSNNFIYHGN